MISKIYKCFCIQMTKLKKLNLGLMGDGKSPHDPGDTWLQNLDFPNEGNFDEFKMNGEFPPEGHLGRLTVHTVHYQNPWIERALCFVEYLKQNKEAFNKYQDVKIEGARMQSTNAEKTEGAETTVMH